MSGLFTLLLAKTLFFGPLVAAAVTDVRSLRIPNLIPASLAVCFPLAAELINASVDWVVHLGVALLVLGAGFVLFTRGMLGGGDVKLLSAATLWYGVDRLMPLMFVVAVGGAVIACVLLVVRRGYRRGWLPRLGALEHVWQWEGIPYGLAIGAGAILVEPGLLMSS